MNKNTNIPPFGEEMFTAFKQFKVPGIDMEALATNHKKKYGTPGINSAKSGRVHKFYY